MEDVSFSGPVEGTDTTAKVRSETGAWRAPPSGDFYSEAALNLSDLSLNVLVLNRGFNAHSELMLTTPHRLMRIYKCKCYFCGAVKLTLTYDLHRKSLCRFGWSG